MNETSMTERLDERGLLADAHGPGCYAFQIETPDSADAAATRWHHTHEHAPPEGTFDRLADAPDVAYVGASGDVYGRLCDHAAGDVRQTAFLAAFEPTRVIDVWPTEGPFEHEFNRAMRLVQSDWVCWVDGRLLG